LHEVFFDGRPVGSVDDAVADVLLEYATALAQFGRSEVVSLPLRVDGRDVRARMLLTAASSLMVVEAGGSREHSIAGSAEAASDLRQRWAALTSTDVADWPADELQLEPSTD